jgi:CopA family copper-resistance protein
MTMNDTCIRNRPALSRRRFVQGLTLAGCSIGASAIHDARASEPGTAATVLTGPELDLIVAPAPFNVTGRARVATAINGSVPAPILRLRQGDRATIRVTNRLSEPTSIHWHGIRLPADQDGVPGLSFAGINPGDTFTYRFPIKQAGTYWYHGHSGMQEQTGLYGPLVLVPRDPEPYQYDRDYVVMLSDWTDEDPMTVLANLKEQSDYYDYHRRTLATFLHDVAQQGFKATLRERLTWGRIRMSPTDIMDVTGATYTFLLNGQPPSHNWTALFKPGEKVRLRFINGSSMTTFDVRIPGLPLRVVAADGADVAPVTVEEFRVGVAETYDVIVEPRRDSAYTLFAQAEDRSGYARGTLAPRMGMAAVVPPMDPRPLRTMVDMGMSMSMAGMGDMPGMSGMPQGQPAPTATPAVPLVNADGVDPQRLRGEPFVDNVAQQSRSRLDEVGDGLGDNGRRVLAYSDLKALEPDPDPRAPARAIEFHLTGNMERFVWGFDGKKYSEAEPVRVNLGERVRFVLINDTMMEHPVHLHGFLFALENGQGDHLPLKHTVNVKPGSRLSFIFTADTPGRWAFHCHLLYHMETGMFRTVLVA